MINEVLGHGRGKNAYLTTWSLNQPIWKKKQFRIGNHFPNLRGEHVKQSILKPPTRRRTRTTHQSHQPNLQLKGLSVRRWHLMEEPPKPGGFEVFFCGGKLTDHLRTIWQKKGPLVTWLFGGYIGVEKLPSFAGIIWNHYNPASAKWPGLILHMEVTFSALKRSLMGPNEVTLKKLANRLTLLILQLFFSSCKIHWWRLITGGFSIQVWSSFWTKIHSYGIHSYGMASMFFCNMKLSLSQPMKYHSFPKKSLPTIF